MKYVSYGGSAILAIACVMHAGYVGAQAPANPPGPGEKSPASLAPGYAPATGVAPATAGAPTAAESPLAPLAWLDGCWRGKVNQREFREHWLPLRGDLMLGVSHTVLQDKPPEKTQDYEYLRLEIRADGVYYVVMPSEGKPSSFKLAGTTTDGDATIFTFTNVVDEFPQRLIYRRGGPGWLYAMVEGKEEGKDRQVIYPMRRISCESGEFIMK